MYSCLYIRRRILDEENRSPNRVRNCVSIGWEKHFSTLSHFSSQLNIDIQVSQSENLMDCCFGNAKYKRFTTLWFKFKRKKHTHKDSNNNNNNSKIYFLLYFLNIIFLYLSILSNFLSVLIRYQVMDPKTSSSNLIEFIKNLFVNYNIIEDILSKSFECKRY